jgi:hypothetical protein
MVIQTMLSKKSMPTKTFLPGNRIAFHMMHSDGDISHYWVRQDAINDLEKNQEQFIKALQIVFEHGLDDGWINDNLELLNKIRLSIGLGKIE